MKNPSPLHRSRRGSASLSYVLLALIVAAAVVVIIVVTGRVVTGNAEIVNNTATQQYDQAQSDTEMRRNDRNTDHAAATGHNDFITGLERRGN